ncbi:hypothetical protein ACFWJ5_10765 [Streptomyces qaidamensis]|uniref:hypothetical protein n=1 Tax=Streptomyces qaidamensis TaxID=1783515 RepID=UPI003648C9D8
MSGNITGPDIERTIGARARLSETGGTVVRARHRGEPGRVPPICRRFEREDFELLWLSEPDAGHGVGAHRFAPGRCAPDCACSSSSATTCCGTALMRQRRNRADFADVAHGEVSDGASGARMVRAWRGTPGTRGRNDPPNPRRRRASSEIRQVPPM